VPCWDLANEEISSRFTDIAEFADIGSFIEQPVKTYSSGMLVRLAFAVAINVDPQILIVDEALSVGDELFQRKCFSRIESIKKHGATILFVSHSGTTVVELCDKALLMDSGENLAMGDPKSIVGKYQKLIYASDEKRIAVLEEIRKSMRSDQGELEYYAIGPKAEELIRTQRSIDGDQTDFFDPNLLSQSTLEYESHGAYILSPQILTLSNRTVNILTRGKVYLYRYNVRFDKSATNVRFGMLIKTISGLELGGAVSASSIGKGISCVVKDTTIEVEFQFVCNLNPGSYFLNAGVTGTIHKEDTFLHRILDIIMFKVMPISEDTATAIIDFNCSTQIRFKNNPSSLKITS
jgi:lipopolysaccharide transport system ATP-binding protein